MSSVLVQILFLPPCVNDVRGRICPMQAIQISQNQWLQHGRTVLRQNWTVGCLAGMGIPFTRGRRLSTHFS